MARGKSKKTRQPLDASDRREIGMNVSRRRFIGGLAAAASGFALAGCSDGQSVGLGNKAGNAASGSAGTNGGAGGEAGAGSVPGAGPNPTDNGDTGGDASDGQTGGDGGSGRLPAPEDSGIEHIVVVMMENRSFDHMLGWLPGADGIQKGLKFPDDNGQMQATYPLAPIYQGCGMDDPGHGYDDYFDQFAGGDIDGWLVGQPDLFPIGYYTQDDLGFFGGAAPAWTTFERYFAATPGPTFPNRFYQHSAQTDRLSNGFNISSLPTIWSRLEDAGLTGRYYFNDIPFLALWGARYLDITRPYAEFLTDAAAGNLPAVSYVDPRFGDATVNPAAEAGATPDGNIDPGNDDHPYADIRDGQAFLNQLYEAVISSPNWKNTVLVINYDEWGGFYDHVLPPKIPKLAQATQKALAADPETGNKFVPRNGFRTPAFLISPLARRGHISSTVYDHTSVLRMIEWRFGLEPLSVRDANANNMAEALDFNSAKNLNAPRFAAPVGPFGSPCAASDAKPSLRKEFQQLVPVARDAGFALPDNLLSSIPVIDNGSSGGSSSGGASTGSPLPDSPLSDTPLSN